MKNYTVLTEYPYSSGEVEVHHVDAIDARTARETVCRSVIEYARRQEQEGGYLSELDPDLEWEDVFVCAIFAGHHNDIQGECGLTEEEAS